jgi:hypothetical protein
MMSREIPEVEPTDDQTKELPIMANRFHIALSFPGEHRDFVSKILNLTDFSSGSW